MIDALFKLSFTKRCDLDNDFVEISGEVKSIN